MSLSGPNCELRYALQDSRSKLRAAVRIARQSVQTASCGTHCKTVGTNCELRYALQDSRYKLRAAVRIARQSVQTESCGTHRKTVGPNSRLPLLPVCHPSAILSPLLLPTEQNKEIQAKIIIYHALDAYSSNEVLLYPAWSRWGTYCRCFSSRDGAQTSG